MVGGHCTVLSLYLHNLSARERVYKGVYVCVFCLYLSFCQWWWMMELRYKLSGFRSEILCPYINPVKRTCLHRCICDHGRHLSGQNIITLKSFPPFLLSGTCWKRTDKGGIDEAQEEGEKEEESERGEGVKGAMDGGVGWKCRGGGGGAWEWSEALDWQTSSRMTPYMYLPLCFTQLEISLCFSTNCCSSRQILTDDVAKETAMGDSCFLGDLLQA